MAAGQLNHVFEALGFRCCLDLIISHSLPRSLCSLQVLRSLPKYYNPRFLSTESLDFIATVLSLSIRQYGAVELLPVWV